MNLSRREKRRLRDGKLVQESPQSKEGHELAKPIKSKSKYYAIGAGILAVILAIASYSVYSISRPGQYDSFAKCLTEKGAVMYGAMDWCKFTQAQKGMFGRSFRHIDYHDFSELNGIKVTPTWVINGKWHENVQSFEKLAALTGCKLMS